MQRNLIFLLYLPVGFMSGFEFLSSAGLILFTLISLVCLLCLLCLVCPRSISFSVLALLVRDRPQRSISLPFSGCRRFISFHFFPDRFCSLFVRLFLQGASLSIDMLYMDRRRIYLRTLLKLSGVNPDTWSDTINQKPDTGEKWSKNDPK